MAVFGIMMIFSISGWGANVDLTLTFTDSPDPVSSGNQLTYTVKVANGNLNKANDVVVTIPLPVGSTYVSGCSLSSGNVSCDFGSILKNTNETLSFIVTAPAISTILSATATVATSDTNLNLASASKTTTTTVKQYGSDNWRLFNAVNYPGSHNMYGDITTIGNSIMVSKTGACLDTSTRNNSAAVTYADVDSNSSTFNSTSAVLSLPASATDKEIVWAGLYWQGYLVDQDDTNKTNARSVLFKTPTASNYVKLTSDTSKFNWLYVTGSIYDRFYYQGVADVTDLVKAAGEGNYTVANVYSSTLDGFTSTQLNTLGGAFGAWSIVIVYKDSSTTFKNISVYDGYVSIGTVGATATGPVFTDYDITLSGFLAPKSGDVNSNFLVFAGEGDAGSGTGDYTKLTSGSGTTNFISLYNPLNPVNNIYNASITTDGVAVTSRDPHCENTIGADIDMFAVGTNALSGTQGQIIQHSQTQTTVRLHSDGDGYFPGVFAFSTQLYVPQFCYDYGYEQNGLPFTEENNGTAMPYITGYLPNLSDINVSLYIRNQENSDVNASNIMFDISDINSSQAIYKRNSVSVTYPDQYTPTSKSDAAWPLSVGDTFIHNIPLGTIGGKKYAYAYYSVEPQKIGNIRIPINGTFSYDLALPLADGTTITLPYSSTIGGPHLPMCSQNNFSYTPEWGIFSMVEAGLYDATAANRYYDLTTQVTKRPGNFRIASFDPVNVDTPKPVSTMVAVELIDASQFHDVDAACREPSSAVTPRIWMTFENNVSQVNFNETTINDAISKGLVSDVITGNPVTLASAAEFFKTATPNAAFRVTFNTIEDANDSLLHIVPTSKGIRIDNFSDIHKVYPHCRQDVTNPNNNVLTNDTAVACSDNGNNSTFKDVAICMECLYGASTKVLCSRDNFAIRPESYTVSLRDMNQTNHNVTQLFAPGYTGVATPNTGRVNVSSGYDYRYDINATNHVDNGATPGYTRYFGTGGTDYNITLVWEPSVAKAGCNDTSSKPQTFNLIDGIAAVDGNLSQVGEYRLHIIDKTWTAVDWNSTMQAHQTGSHFLSGAECVQNSADVPLQANVVGLTGVGLTNLVGCDISSIHDNSENGLKYRDYELTFNPYKFNMSSIGFGVGIVPRGITSGGNDFVYMSNISRDDSMNMSLHATGSIAAVGYNGITTTNFVTDCYAKDLNMTLASNNNLSVANTAYQVRFMDFNSTGGLIFDSNATDINTSSLAMALTSISDGNFTKDTAGSLSTLSRFNYNRSFTLPVNPKIASFADLGIKCASPAECIMQADFSASHEALGDKLMDFNITYAYGRIIPRDVRVFGDVDFTANAWYEVYNTPVLAVTPLAPSRNGDLWYINQLHNDNNDGDGNVTRLQSSVGSTAVNIAGVAVNGVETYNFNNVGLANIPYSRKAHIDTDPWLWYSVNALDYSDPSDANLNCLTHPCFNINVVPAVGRGGSATETGLRTDKANKATSGNGVIYDYTPATR